MSHLSYSLSFSAADNEALERFNIFREGPLVLHPEGRLRQAIIASRAVGSDTLWSNDTMYRHLSFLVNSFTSKNQIPPRIIIDTFFFRSTAMVPPPLKVIVMQENQVDLIHPRPSQMDTVSGIIDYTAIVTDSSTAADYLRAPLKVSKRYSGAMIGFFVVKVALTIPLEGYLPQVLLELVACAKHLGKSHIRGALTTGFEWQFVVVDLNADGDGAKYWASDPIQWKWKVKVSELEPRGMRLIEENSDEYDPALIAGILASWIPESFAEFTDNQWFVKLSRGD